MKENASQKFILHAQLEQDTFHAGAFKLSEILLMNDSRYPWLILVPRLPNLTDITDLNQEKRKIFIEEINFTADAMKKYFKPERINIAMLGNVVSQLHCHIIARFKNDFAWSKPVWGIGEAAAYNEKQKDETLKTFQEILFDKIHR